MLVMEAERDLFPDPLARRSPPSGHMNDQLILGRYRLIERLALGGSAEVWRAHDEQLDRPVAVKRLHPHLLPDESSRKRLAAEARAAASLSHPVIVDIYDVDATGEAPALVMELVDGESLSARIARSGPLEPREAASMAADIAEALFHAHQRGVVHRDVKPGNVLLASDGRTKLVDFGIAHSLAESAERLTMTGTVVGTMSAMAPEQLLGGPITPRTDLYGIGVVLYEALTGRPPYPGGSPVALAEAQRAGPPPLDGIDPTLAGDRRRVPGSRAREPAAARGCAGGRVALVAGGRRGAGDCHGTNRDASLGRRHRCRHDGGRRAGCGADRPHGCCSRSTTEGSLSSRPAARRLRPCSAPR